jgi:hypothetical protein
MDTPIPALMQHYGTEDVFLAKLAGEAPLAMGLAARVLSYRLAEKMRQEVADQQLEDRLRYEARREYELAKIRQVNQNLRHTRVPLIIPAGSDLPAGWDEGMVRLASIAAETGADMAKEAGIGDFVATAKSFGSKIVPTLKQFGTKAVNAVKPFKAPPIPKPPAPEGDLTSLVSEAKDQLKGKLGLGWKGNLALTGLAAGGLALGSKGISAASREMNREPQGPPAPYGGPRRGVGYQLPYGVNEYGQPTLGTPFM